MILVDSSGWIEFFRGGPLADKYFDYLKDSSRLIVPTILIYEVYKKIKKEVGQQQAILAISKMAETNIIPLNDSLALFAADVSLQYKLPMANAIVYATALNNNARLITSDKDFAKLANVTFLRI